jgi:hypothetical protein
MKAMLVTQAHLLNAIFNTSAWQAQTASLGSAQ